MENIQTLLAAVAQTQGFDDDEPLVSTALENSESKTGINGSKLTGDVRPPTPSPPLFPATSALGQAIRADGRKKRGRPAKPHPSKRTKVEDEEEDVCFICFDGGSLVLCDRKGCPKAYHPACIKRDEAFFSSKAKWNCGWHICSVCQKASHYMCYTCTYSLCKTCTKDADYVRVRGNKGFCSTCMNIITLIENKDQANNESVQVDFDDQRNWEYLFKWYWVTLKESLSLTFNELTQAKRPWKGVSPVACKPELCAPVDGTVPNLHRSVERLELNRRHLEISLEQNDDGLKTTVSNADDYVKKQNCDKKEDWPVCPKDTIKPHMGRVSDESIIDKVTGQPDIEKDLSKPIKDTDNLSICKDTDNLSICKNTNNQEADKPINGDSTEWASKGLLGFVALLRNGDTSAMSQFDVQSLVLDYIKRNNLRDPNQKSQIICDLRLKNLFGKPRVGHFEMLQLLEFHFLNKEYDKSSLTPAGFVTPVTHDKEVGEKVGLPAPISSRKRKTRKRSQERASQQNLSEYAAIDAHNINLIYLRRSFMEKLLEDQENFNNTVIESIVRIKALCNDQKQDVYRLVQVVGTSKVAEHYKIGEKTTNVMLEVLNLNKKEIVSVDAISDQEFTEDECRRLRQSIRCGLVKHFTVGEVLKKAMALKAVRINDLMEAEIVRLNHLRDRASENGRKRQLREYIDKLEILKSPDERRRRAAEVPEIHADPKMSPNYESEEDTRSNDDQSKSEFTRQSYLGFPRNGRKASPPNKKGKIKNEQCIQPEDRLRGKTDASGSHSSDKHVNQNTVTAPANGRRDDLTMQRPGLPTSTVAVTTGTSLSPNNIETEKLWHYRDPNAKIQGPFSMMQLRKWSKTGLFPSDMRIWTNHEQYDSLLLIDALNGHICGKSKLSNKSSLGSQKNRYAGGIWAPNERVSPDKNSQCVKEKASDTSWLNGGHLCGESKLSNKPSLGSQENKSAGVVGASGVTTAASDKNSGCAKENVLGTSWLMGGHLCGESKLSNKPSLGSQENKPAGGIEARKVRDACVSSDKNSGCAQANARNTSLLNGGHLCEESKLSNKPSLGSQEDKSAAGDRASEVTNVNILSDENSGCVKENAHDTSRLSGGHLRKESKLPDEPSLGSQENRSVVEIGASEVINVIISSDKNSGYAKENAHEISRLNGGHLCEVSKLPNEPSLGSQENRSIREIGASEVTNVIISSDKNSGCAKENAHDISRLNGGHLCEDSKLPSEPPLGSQENRSVGEIEASEVANVIISSGQNSGCAKENVHDISRLNGGHLCEESTLPNEPSLGSQRNKSVGEIVVSEVTNVIILSDKDSGCVKGSVHDTSRLGDHLCEESKLPNELCLGSQENMTVGEIGASEVTSVIFSSDKNSGCVHDTSWLKGAHSREESKLANEPSLRGAGGIVGSQVSVSISSDQDSGCVKENVHDISWLHSWDLLKDDNPSATDVHTSRGLALSAHEPTELALPFQDQENNEFNHCFENGGKNLNGSAQSWTGETQCNNEDPVIRSPERNLRSQNIDLNSNNMESSSVVATASKSPDLSEQVGKVDILNLYSPTPNVENTEFPGLRSPVPKAGNIEIPDFHSPTRKTAENQLSISGFLDLLSPMSRANNEDQRSHVTETNQSGVVNLGPSWSSASVLTVGGVQLPDIADEWCGYSPTPAKPPVQEWESTVVSASSLGPEVTDAKVPTSGSGGHQIMLDPPPNPPNITNWLDILNGPIEFDALGEEYVSDLLAEVDAMESQGASLPSPTSAAKFSREFLEDCRDDCFSSIGDFSPAPDPKKCDTSQEMQYSSQSSVPCRHVETFANSYGSSVGETNAPVFSADTGSEFHPPEPNNINQEMVDTHGSDAIDPGWGTVQGNINLVTVQGNVNLVLGGPGQGMSNIGWGTNPGTGYINHNSLTVGLPWDGQRMYNGERYTSPRERGYQGSSCSETGFGRGRPPRGRQLYSVGGYSRAPGRGQRVCKFYESGRCKKGAYCDYLHP